MKPFEPFEVSIDGDGRAYIDIIIYRHDRAKKATVKFKYDSGSDTTTISWEDLTSLGYTFDDIKNNSYPYGSTSTASGEKYESYAIDLGTNNIMGQVIPAGLIFPFTCLTKREVKKPENCDMDCELTGCFYGGYRSLLGNDILSAFDVSSDRNSGKIIFTRLRDLTIRNAKYPNSILNEVQFEYD